AGNRAIPRRASRPIPTCGARHVSSRAYEPNTKDNSILAQPWRRSTRLADSSLEPMARAVPIFLPICRTNAPKHHMLANDTFHIAVLPGDGIGPEVMA